MPIEKRGTRWRVRARWKDRQPFQATVNDQKLASYLDAMLEEISRRQRFDIYDALVAAELDPVTVWEAVKVTVPDGNGVFVDRPDIRQAFTVESLKAFHRSRGVSKAGGAQPVIGVAPVAPTATIEDLRHAFFADLSSGVHLNRRRLKFAPATIERYQVSFNALFTWDPSLARRPVDALTDETLDEFRVARVDGGGSNSTANRDCDMLQTFFTWIEKHRPQYQPARRPKAVKLREPKPKDRAMTREHFDRWHDVQQHHPDVRDFIEFRPVFALTGSCALRISEAQGLRRCDIERENGRPKWARIEEYPGHTLKSPAAPRTVGLTEDVIPMIEAQLATPGAPTDPLWPERLRDYDKAHYAFEKTCITAGLHDGGAHYLTRLEQKLDAQVANGELTALGKRNALERAKAHIPRTELKALYTMHSLRHTLATRLADDGMPINNLRLLLGQASIETTLLYIGKALTKFAASDAASRSVRVMPFAATAVVEED
jgi:site-specific recombinase XerD